PGEMDRTNVAGNFVLIQADGTEAYVVVAHLMQGTVVVRRGDHVSVGQRLGMVGNSGNTSEPHVHIHAKRGGKPDSVVDGEGVRMRFGGRWLVRNSLVRCVIPSVERRDVNE